MSMEKITATAIVVNQQTRQISTVTVDVEGITADGTITQDEELKVAQEIYSRGLVDGNWQVTEVQMQERTAEATFEMVTIEGSTFEQAKVTWKDVGESRPFHLQGAGAFFAPRDEILNKQKWVPRFNRDGFQVWEETRSGKLYRVPLSGGKVEKDVSDSHGPGWLEVTARDGVPLLVPVSEGNLVPWPKPEESASPGEPVAADQRGQKAHQGRRDHRSFRSKKAKISNGGDII